MDMSEKIFLRALTPHVFAVTVPKIVTGSKTCYSLFVDAVAPITGNSLLIVVFKSLAPVEQISNPPRKKWYQ